MSAAHSPTPFGVYIHWPFCAQKCPYCDFNSHVRHGGWDEDRFLAAYTRELDHVARELAGPRTVSSIFLGGGTPSLMRPGTVEQILDHIAGLWALAPDVEVTLEANPGSVEAARFAAYRTAGVNRVSIGIQSLRDEELSRLGRIHTVAEAKAALEIARSTFDRYSLDLIYARPRQSVEAWRSELAEALALAGGHLSLYQLTIEPDTPFAALHAAGRLIVPDGETSVALYEVTQEMTENAGLPAYEISNHARPGDECRHNLLYWRYGEYAGIGPGAHGRLVRRGTRLATVTERNPETWCTRVEQQGHGLETLTPLSREEEADECLLMGLRLREGLALDRLESVSGLCPSRASLDELVQLGLLEHCSPEPFSAEVEPDADIIRSCVGPGLPPAPAPLRIRATPRGRLVLNQVVYRLAAGLQRRETAAVP